MLLFFIHGAADTIQYERTVEISAGFNVWKMKIHRGDFYIQGDDVICRVDREGKLLNRIGRKGEGPGDFKILTDFCLDGDRLVAADNHGRVNVFGLDGTLVRMETMPFGKIWKILVRGENMYCFHEKLNRNNIKDITIENILNFNHKEILKFPDESRQRAYDPKRRKRSPLPWFVSPYYNRPVLLRGDAGSVFMFFTRSREFFHITGNDIRKRTITAEFSPVKITPQDRDLFFKQVERASGRTFHRKTKNSVVFPKTKELFLGAVNWDSHFGLLACDRLVIVNPEGTVVNEIDYPDELRFTSRETFEGSAPEDIFIKDKNRFYLMNTDGNIKIFKILSE